MDLENTKPKLKMTTTLINNYKTCYKENCDLFISNCNKFFCDNHFNEIKESTICQGINNSKKQCKYKVIKDGFCGHHLLKTPNEDKISVEYNHSRKIRINITPKQLNVFRQIFGVSRKVYNSALYELRKKNTTKKELRDYITKKLDNEFEYVKNVPLKIKQESVGDLIKALDNCYKKFKKTNKSQKCKYRNKKAPSQSIYMNVDSIKKENNTSFYFYPDAISKRYFKNKKDALLEVSENLPEIKTHCRLILKHNKYLYISIPMEMPKYKKDSILKDSFVALDPGERCFQTFYSRTLNGQIGYKTRERYMKVLNEADLIKSKIDLLRNKIRRKKYKNKKIILKNVIKKLRKKYLSAITKPTRLSKELHDKTALFLCKNFKIIAIPEYSSQSLSKNLPEIINRCNQSLSHYKFRERLIHKAKQWNRIVHIVPESYTSITCTKCGNCNERDKSEYLECSRCNLKIHRDIAGSRNILIKTKELIESRQSELGLY